METNEIIAASTARRAISRFQTKTSTGPYQKVVVDQSTTRPKLLWSEAI